MQNPARGEAVVGQIVREQGLNTYQRITGYNVKPNTHDYWQRIRAEWNRRVAAGEDVRLAYPMEGMKMIMDMYWQPERAKKSKPVSDQNIHDLFEPWVKAP